MFRTFYLPVSQVASRHVSARVDTLLRWRRCLRLFSVCRKVITFLFVLKLTTADVTKHMRMSRSLGMSRTHRGMTLHFRPWQADCIPLQPCSYTVVSKASLHAKLILKCFRPLLLTKAFYVLLDWFLGTVVLWNLKYTQEISKTENIQCCFTKDSLNYRTVRVIPG